MNKEKLGYWAETYENLKQEKIGMEKAIEKIKSEMDLISTNIQAIFEESDIESIKINGFKIEFKTNYFLKAKRGMEQRACEYINYNFGKDTTLGLSLPLEEYKAIENYIGENVDVKLNLHWKTGDSVTRQVMESLDSELNPDVLECFNEMFDVTEKQTLNVTEC